MSKIIAGALIGFLLGLIFCYWKQIRQVVDNRGVISKGAAFVGAGEELYNELFRKV